MNTAMCLTIPPSLWLPLEAMSTSSNYCSKRGQISIQGMHVCMCIIMSEFLFGFIFVNLSWIHKTPNFMHMCAACHKNLYIKTCRVFSTIMVCYYS